MLDVPSRLETNVCEHLVFKGEGQTKATSSASSAQITQQHLNFRNHFTGRNLDALQTDPKVVGLLPSSPFAQNSTAHIQTVINNVQNCYATVSLLN